MEQVNTPVNARAIPSTPAIHDLAHKTLRMRGYVMGPGCFHPDFTGDFRERWRETADLNAKKKQHGPDAILRLR
jgi:hypothetical protein